MVLKRKAQMETYQTEIAKLIVRLGSALIVLPVGGGKTVSALTAIAELLAWASVRRVLIVGPLRVVEEVWPDEIRGWEHLRHLDFSVVTGSEQGRLFALRAPARIHLINRENLPWLWGAMQQFDLRPFDMIVVDESRMLAEGRRLVAPTAASKSAPTAASKSAPAKRRALTRFGALLKIRSLPGLRHPVRVVLLTGTPFSEGVIDAWGQLFMLDLGQRLGSSRSAFLQRWFESDYQGFKQVPREGAVKDIIKRCSDIVVAPDISAALASRQVKVIPKQVFVTLGPRELQRYHKFERTLVEQETNIEAVSQGVLTNKLLQFANGSMYRDEDEAVHVHDKKLEALVELVEELKNENVLVAYSYQFDLGRIRRVFPKAVVLAEDPDAYRAWNRGDIKMLLAHPASAGHGLNLQFGGHHAIWYGLSWSVELYEQFNGRLPRRGQTSEWVMLHHILARGTKDEAVYRKLVAGVAAQKDLIGAFRTDLGLDFGTEPRHAASR